VWIQRPDASALFRPTDGVVATRGRWELLV
jgi:hypothetical protein